MALVAGSRLGPYEVLEHPDLSPPEKPPPDIRDVVRVPLDDEGPEIEPRPA